MARSMTVALALLVALATTAIANGQGGRLDLELRSHFAFGRVVRDVIFGVSGSGALDIPSCLTVLTHV